MRVEKSEIAGKLRKLKNILNRRLDSAELNGVLFKDNCLYATNLEIGIKTTINSVNDNESFIIPKAAIDLIENLPDGMVEIISEDKTVTIKSGTIKNKYQSFSADTYIEMQPPEIENNNVTVSSGEFLDALDSILYAVSESAAKEALKGVLLDAHDGMLNIVGCDGFRIAWSKIKYNDTFKVIIPKSTIKQILTFGISGDISFAWDDKSIRFKTDEYEVTSRILSGEFLNYEKMFVEYPNETVVDRKLIIECLKRAMICSDDKSKNALRCLFEDSKLSVNLHKCNSEYEETVTLEVPISEKVEIGFNVRYLLDAMNSFMSDKVSVKLGSGLQAMIIDDGDLNAMVLPVRL